jgi:hypothetical protein
MASGKWPTRVLLLYAVMFWICIFLIWAGDFAVIPSSKGLEFFAEDAVLKILAALFGYLFLRRVFLNGIGK